MAAPDTAAPSAADGVVVRIERGTNPFDDLTNEERLRLIVCVLCELVAYGETTDSETTDLKRTNSEVTVPEVTGPQIRSAAHAGEPIAASG